MYVEATFISGVRATLFDMTLLFYYEDTLYQENFEDELFLARTNYSNSANPKLDGRQGINIYFEWRCLTIPELKEQNQYN